jgi:hypothetical protein
MVKLLSLCFCGGRWRKSEYCNRPMHVSSLLQDGANGVIANKRRALSFFKYYSKYLSVASNHKVFCTRVPIDRGLHLHEVLLSPLSVNIYPIGCLYSDRKETKFGTYPLTRGALQENEGHLKKNFRRFAPNLCPPISKTVPAPLPIYRPNLITLWAFTKGFPLHWTRLTRSQF